MNEETIRTIYITSAVIGLSFVVLLVLALLAVLRIAKYQKATMILMALIAKEEEADPEVIQSVLNEADRSILLDGNIENAIVN